MDKAQNEIAAETKSNRLKLMVCLFLPALLFWLAWEPMPFTPLVFIAFVPFFYLAEWGRSTGKGKNFGVLFLAFNYVVGLVCFRCWCDCHVYFEFFVDVSPIWTKQMVTEKKVVQMGC
jgi:apolipoprotein N-acyltransferase